MKVINKTRVLKTPNNIGDQVVLYIPITAVNHDVKNKYGLNELNQIGQSIIPEACGSSTRRNVDGEVKVHRDLPKEKYFREYYWTRNQWVGGGETETISGWVRIKGMRYPRTYYPAVNMELQLRVNTDGEQFYAAQTIQSADEYTLVTSINTMLEIFGTVYLASIPFKDLITPIKIDRQVSWQFLPKGSRSIEQLKRDLHIVFRSTKKKSAVKLFHQRLEHINETLQPKTVTIGLGGFSGYVAFTFEKLGFTILECIHPNNATYVFDGDWKVCSQLSKTKILSEGLASHRIIHNRHWFDNINQLIKCKLIA